jgi:hypothetical protein
MSNQTRYNQMLFLTTLSVYMGLVLVGSPPQVLAQVLAETSAPHIKFEINKAKFSTQASFERVQLEKAPHFSEFFSSLHKPVKFYAGTTEYFLQDTATRAENDQNFVVTRLPRGSIDPLLA